VHIGPHFGSYDEEVTETRVSEILCYALDVLNFGSPDFPDPPAYPDPVSASSVGSRISRHIIADNSIGRESSRPFIVLRLIHFRMPPGPIPSALVGAPTKRA